MEKYALTMDISKVYQESFRMIFTNVESVKPEQEYQSFIQENRRYVEMVCVCLCYDKIKQVLITPILRGK